MKKMRIFVLIAAVLALGLTSCSKKTGEQKAEFFTQLEALVKKAENNTSIEAVEEIQNKYAEFFKKYPNITSTSGWKQEDTEKLDDLMKRFTVATVIPVFSDDNTLNEDSPVFDNSDLGFSDLGLDDDLNFGGDALGNMLLEDLNLSGTPKAPALGNDLLGGLDLGALSPSASSSDSGFSDLTIPDFSLKE